MFTVQNARPGLGTLKVMVFLSVRYPGSSLIGAGFAALITPENICLPFNVIYIGPEYSFTVKDSMMFFVSWVSISKSRLNEDLSLSNNGYCIVIPGTDLIICAEVGEKIRTVGIS